ncbi:MAG: trimethylamine-N-oxide reductase TorA [Pseudomonadales bacterium]|jgi:trimethylamine-N-oxide reductase (cytochrome c)|nr:trimethylamine-N-oxide reductase TorA [Pseudomonadales bacterium]MDP7595210.1 trimethylamine-N-oxide reductase TorA [Pseudomonadales bacterium]HJN53131.1 trimethylamine-N-oxide reductase TorA [Pseudomonadales bacterium]
MSNHKEQNRASSITRRNFMTTTATSALTAAFSPSLISNALAEGKQAGEAVREVLTGSHWGAMHATVKNGRLVSALPFRKDPFPNPLVNHTPEHVYSDSRVKYPMVRAGFLEKKHLSDTSQRGRDEFVRVSWDSALDLVADELQRVKQKHGPTAIYAGNQNWKSSGRFHNCGAALTRLLNLLGGYSPSYTNYSTGAMSVILPYVLGSWDPISRPTAWPVVIESSELVILWGSDPKKSLKVGWLIPSHSGLEGLQQLKASGKRVVVIDPFRSDSAEYLSAEWVAPRPGTDVALMLGIGHTLFESKLFDRAFIDRYTVGFDRFRSYLTGESDGVPKSAQWAADICHVDAALIRGLAASMAENRTMLIAGWSLQRADHGEQVPWMLITLASMLGQIGLPGGGFSLNYHYGSAGSVIADGANLGGLSSDSAPPGMPAPMPGTRISDALLNPGQTIDFRGEKVTYPHIKLIYWAGGNPFSHHQDINKLLRGWRKPETVIVNEQFWTATAKHADIVLPATTSFERNDLEQAGQFSGQFIIPMHKVIEPLFEARNDFDIFAEIAYRLGVGDAYTEGKSEMEWLESFYILALRQARFKELRMPSFHQFWQSGRHLEFAVPKNASSWVCMADYREDPAYEALATASGKIEIYSKAIEKLGYEDLPAHPTWIEPAEWMGSGKAEKYPLHLLSPHPTARVHSQMAHIPQRRDYTIAEREPIWINSEDAKDRGIRQGDLVRVFNERGQVLGGANVSERMRAGVVQMQEGGWYDPQDPTEPGSLCQYGTANVLTLDKGTSQLAQATSANSTLVNIEKYAGDPSPVTAFQPPKERKPR